MFTSRAEYRLLLREDNADLRLTPLARELGLVDDERWRFFERKRTGTAREIERLASVRVRPQDKPRGKPLATLFWGDTVKIVGEQDGKPLVELTREFFNAATGQFEKKTEVGAISAKARLRATPLLKVPAADKNLEYYWTVDGLFGVIDSAQQRGVQVRTVYDDALGYPREVYIDYDANFIGDELDLRLTAVTPISPAR